jgi:hypothetical protein
MIILIGMAAVAAFDRVVFGEAKETTDAPDVLY